MVINGYPLQIWLIPKAEVFLTVRNIFQRLPLMKLVFPLFWRVHFY